MNLHGAHHFTAEREAVFAAICDPRVLMAVIPGCEGVERTGPDAYEGRIALRLPGAAGSYRTRVRLVDADAPERAGLEGTVDGAMGTVAGRAEFELRASGAGTDMAYRGSATIGGPLARLDGHLIERFAESLIDQGLRALDSCLAEEGVG